MSIPKINYIQKPFKIQPSINYITNKIIKNVNEPLINSRKSENVTQTKSSSHVEEIYSESNKKIIFEYRKMFEFSNFCIDKMKEIKKNEADYEKIIHILTYILSQQRVRTNIELRIIS